MKTRHVALLAVLAVAVMAGCSSTYEPTPKILKIDKGWIISDTSSLSHTLVRNQDAAFLTCAEPPPDAAFDQADSGDVNIALIALGNTGKSDKAGESSSAQEVELAGRTPAVLMSRELFFRACEFSLNYQLDKADALKLYNRTLDIVRKNWAIEAGRTTVTVGDTIATKQDDTVTDTDSQNTSSSNASSASSGASSTSTSSDSSDSSDTTSDDSFGDTSE